MLYVSIAGQQYPATITGRINDKDWNDRPTKSIKLEMTYAEAIEIWNDGVSWSILSDHTVREPKLDDDGNEVLDENGEVVMTDAIETEEFDNSDYSLAGDITDHRDGYVTVKMGKLTPLEEAYEFMLGGI